MSNDQYIVSARKYRPATFRSVVGQKNLTETLRNAVQTGRLAQAYLFCGPRGVGKTSCARIFAKTINCLNPTADGEACGECESCVAIQEGRSFNIIELDAASNNKVDDIRDITEQVHIPPTTGRYRVFIIDEVHMLTSQAFNAFLKTLEEPPSYVIFILATTEKHKVIPTILSRCQIYDFKRITIQDMVDHLQYVAREEDIEADVPSLNVIAKKADGAMRDALSIFDQVVASSFGKLTYEKTIAALNVLDYDIYFRLVDTFRAGNVQEALMIYKEVRDRGFDTLVFINGLASHVRDLMVAYSPSTASLLEVANDVAGKYMEQARSLPVDWLYAAMKILSACDINYRTASNKQFLTELTLIRLCQLLNPPAAPFDRVEDDDTFPLRDLVLPPSRTVPSQVAQTPPTHTPHPVPAATPETTPEAQPSPETAVRPAPHSAPARSGRRRAAAKPEAGDASTVRISDINALSADSSLTRKHEPVSPEAFSYVWETFIASHGELHVLTSAMRKFAPVQKDADTFTVRVDHPAQFQAFTDQMAAILEDFRRLLSNDFLTLEVTIDETGQTRHIPSQELLKEIAEANPVLAGFLAGIDSEII